MKPLSENFLAVIPLPLARRAPATLMAAALALSCNSTLAGPPTTVHTSPSTPLISADIRIEAPPDQPRPPFKLDQTEDAFLDEVQRAAFYFLWDAAHPATGMVVDRSSVTFASVAGVGFQLAALPCAAERGWITPDDARERALLIIAALERSPRHAGLFFHFFDAATAQTPPDAYEHVVSTIDSAILLSGLIVASSGLGGEVARRADALIDAADWRAFTDDRASLPEHWRGRISLGWKPDDKTDVDGPGSLLPYYWIDAGDEQRLITFLAAGSDRADRIPPSMYYHLRRDIGFDPACGLLSFFPWSGALFTSFFAHCFIDYAAIGLDHPAAHGAERRARVDWWENARRHVAHHPPKAADAPPNVSSKGDNAWGLTAMDFAGGYQVPGLYPQRIKLADARAPLDVELDFTPKDDFGDGSIAPYGAGCSIMFEPAAALAALRHYHALKRDDGSRVVWQGLKRPAEAPPDAIPRDGEFGFRDSFNLDTAWTAPDYVAIDQGPLVLAIENARTGRVWTLFHAHPLVQKSMDRLGLSRAPRR